jgi:hypothetical protein
MAFWLLFSALLLATASHAQSRPDSTTMPVAGDLISPNDRRSESLVGHDPDWFATLVRELNEQGLVESSPIATLLVKDEPD